MGGPEKLTIFLIVFIVSQEGRRRHCQGYEGLEGFKDHSEADHPEPPGPDRGSAQCWVSYHQGIEGATQGQEEAEE